MRDLSFCCLANLAAELSPLSLGAPSGADGAGQGRKVNLVFQMVEGTPDEGNGLPNSYRWDREVGGGEAV